ncbi:hypothetical protein FHU38_004802 [Saccharomonospora amisosensis]|uniref:Uncharacterized protein n=1 Tax=Saccharomonospora amisosensis TaxID=1128677 RepID=A0A7X5UUC5_9PSEU|nr:hypothetical protein [Saccharomonospora amisosensis]NIJ14401.1 hypothetical protein [Saccharomonospora amisosensis]
MTIAGKLPAELAAAYGYLDDIEDCPEPDIVEGYNDLAVELRNGMS